MDRTMKVFFFFCFVVFFFTGCGKNGNRNEKINGPDSKDAAKSAMQLKAETQAKELEELSKLLRTADTLFTQVWVEVGKIPGNKADKADPNNVFRMVRNQIDLIQKVEKQLKENPETPKETDKNKKVRPLSAQLDDVQIFIETEQKTVSPAEARSQGISQSSTAATAATANATGPRPADAKKTTPTPPTGAPIQQKSPVTPPAKTTTKYTLKFQQKGEKDATSALTLATFEKNEKGSWLVNFVPGNLAGEFNAIGRLFTMVDLGQMNCTFMPSKQGRLQEMNCGKIGQELNANKVVLYSQFYVNTLSEKKLMAKGEIINDLVAEGQEREKPVALNIFDLDSKNQLVIDVTKIIESVEAEKAAPPKAENASDAQGATPSEAGNTTSGATGENKESNGSQSGDAANGNDRAEDKESKDKKEDGQSGQNGTSEAQPGEGGQQNDQGADAAGAGGELPPEAVT